ncbi:MAG: hypothetical protein KC589_04595 [Nanoarchaeota archaeon]|nr:hypothetical protein [Nanoarchaeota archaeon]
MVSNLDNIGKFCSSEEKDIIEIQKLISEFTFQGEFDFNSLLKLAKDKNLIYYKGKFQIICLKEDSFYKNCKIDKKIPFIIETSRKTNTNKIKILCNEDFVC